MNDMKTKVAIVQWAPAVHDIAAGVARAAEAIDDAAGQGAQLVAFPEVWLQGYLYWGSDDVRTPGYQACLARLFDQSVAVDAPVLDPLYEAARRNAVHVHIGLHEREGGTLYAAQLFIGPDGRLIGKRRKLMPTTVERLVWGRGDGSEDIAHDTPFGKVGGLMCFEHHIALARHACAQAGTQIHVSAWPGHAFLDAAIDACTRQLAFENGCFVLVAREIFDPTKHLARGMPEGIIQPAGVHGGSAIIAPTGEYLVGPVFDEETILVAEIDLSRILQAKWWFDPVGHYSRPDVFRLQWDKRAKPATEIRS